MQRYTQGYGHSPQSSVGAGDSIQGTPDTKLTAFSPEDARAFKPAESKMAGVLLNAIHHDPFVTGTESSAKPEQKLSPTASAFLPNDVSGGSMSMTSSTAPVAASSVSIPGIQERWDQFIASLNTSSGGIQDVYVTHQGTFSTDAGVGRCFKVWDHEQGDAKVAVTQSLNSLASHGIEIGKNYRIFSLGNDVYLRFSNIEEAINVFSVIHQDHPNCGIEYIPASTFGQAVSPGSTTTYSAHEGQVLLEAKYPSGMTINKKDFEESLRALLSAEAPLYAWQKLLATEAGTFRMVAEFIDSSMAGRAVARCNKKIIGNVAVTVCMHIPDIHVPQAPPTVASTPTRHPGGQPEMDDLFGQISQMSLNNTPGAVFQGNTSMFSTTNPNQAGMAYMTPNPFVVPQTSNPATMGYPGSHIALPYQQYYTPYTPQALNEGSGLGNVGSMALVPHGFAHDMFNPSNFGQFDLSPTHTSSYGFSGLLSPASSHDYGSPSYHGRRQGSSRSPLGRRQYSNAGAGHHNTVDIHRIRLGIDVRTTVMLRNIPNKVDQKMLKSIVDESSFGRYDFMYLRIDFSNNCNVGYAFINFVDPLDIINFVLARANQKWHRFNSDKVAEVSYATIQGRDCLIQKFRNSSVMLEPAHYRPKLFLTVNDPYGRAGEEDEFPASDNASKLKRSCENAEHVGLFAPSAGQHLRDEQRRRRSQYDRGTSLAEREEYGFGEELDFHQSYSGLSPY